MSRLAAGEWTTARLERFLSSHRPTQLLLKLSARCNIACRYCYWFQDESVYDRPKNMSADVWRGVLARVDEYFESTHPDTFHVSFHGGEPLLVGKVVFRRMCLGLRVLASRHHVPLRLSVQTNGILLDEEWIAICREFDVAIGISLDGDKVVNDVGRVDFSGKSTHDAVVRAVNLIQHHGLSVGLLAVWTPASDADSLYRYFTQELNVRSFDVLLPDHTYDLRGTFGDPFPFYARLFDLWYETDDSMGTDIRICSNLLAALLGSQVNSESLGWGPTTTFAIGTDGRYEILDVMNILGSGAARTSSSIWETKLAGVREIPEWKRQVTESVTLSDTCRRCTHKIACGGGYLPSRWSKSNGFNNSSSHCDTLFRLFEHVRERIEPDLAMLRGLARDGAPAAILD